MAMGTERSKALHNFTMPGGLRWGNQRFLRCLKDNSNAQISSLPRFTSDHRHHHPIQLGRTTRDRDQNSSPEFVHGSPKLIPTLPLDSDDARKFSNTDYGIAGTREKVMLDLQSAANKMKHTIFKDGLEERKFSISPPPPPPAAMSKNSEMCRPWNLRTRLAGSRTSVSGIIYDRNDGPTASGGGNSFKADLPIPDSGLPQIWVEAAAILKSPIHKADGSGNSASDEKNERPKFSVSLSKREIEEDFFEMARHRARRRPNKRAKIVQQELDTLFPGLFLTEVNSDMYKVPEAAAPWWNSGF